MKKTLSQRAEEIRVSIPYRCASELAKYCKASARWIREFKTGMYPNPGVRTLDDLEAGIVKYKDAMKEQKRINREAAMSARQAAKGAK